MPVSARNASLLLSRASGMVRVSCRFPHSVLRFSNMAVLISLPSQLLDISISQTLLKALLKLGMLGVRVFLFCPIKGQRVSPFYAQSANTKRGCSRMGVGTLLLKEDGICFPLLRQTRALASCLVFRSPH